MKLTLTVEQVEDEDDGGLIWEARIAEYPQVCGLNRDYPCEAAQIAVDDAISLWVMANRPYPRTDTQLLDGLEALVDKGECPAVLNDDNGHWAVSGTGMQTICSDGGPYDIKTSFYVAKDQWKPSIRDAINTYLDAAEIDTDDTSTP